MEGVVSGASLLMTAAYTDQAVDIARDLDMAVGPHLSLVHDKPLLPVSDVPSLVSDHNRFHDHYTQFLKFYLTGRINTSEIELELRHQIENFLETGLEPRFINSHEHLHLIPGLFRIVKKLSLEYEIPYVRTVDEYLFPGRWNYLDFPVYGIKTLSKLAQGTIEDTSVLTNEKFSGVYLVETPTIENWDRFLSGLSEGVTEMGVHVASKNFTENHGMQKERQLKEMVEVLCSDRFKKLIADNNVQLQSIPEIVGNKKAV
jgi:predicted glycoside hydrolase/deacetylase ChbG (UPF0249 family)